MNPYYQSYDYGRRTGLQNPIRDVWSGNLVLVYHAEIPTIQAQSFYSVLGLAASTDAGLNWTDLGEIIRVNQAYRTDLDGFDIGDPPLVLSPDGEYFYIYFEDWLANGTTHWGTTLTLASVLAAAFGSQPHAASFQKYYDGD